MKRLITAALVCASAVTATACADYYPPPPPPPPPGVVRAQHVRWCYDHHPRYDARSNVYIADDGSPHYCLTPWER